MNTLMTKTEDLTRGMNELMSLLCGQLTASSITEMNEADFKLLQTATKLVKTSNEVLEAQTKLFYEMDQKLDKILSKD